MGSSAAEIRSPMIVADTHVLLWLDGGDAQLGASSRRLLDKAYQHGELCAAAISFWEVAMLQLKGRIRLNVEVDHWRQQLLRSGIAELPLTGDIGIKAAQLRDDHSDPADRILVATAKLNDATLITADQHLLRRKLCRVENARK